ncbi:Retrovirus-related Pol polyprotein from transposon TNT 1-94 [Morus notabilis]|uniref:Retrovirus-related Pol polyprotein from transposon TNT 1-94 n=1 Tax=Morus notabilis TaxID=981085 RepID=W9RQX6_9ROSA|nr:Retrovirus-related Pol polyprotein from transposon TNT 1-94 [Morus notabilis]
MRALERNHTWDVVRRPREKALVGCKWVFTVKYKADGSIERYKACLVAKGYTQTYGIDYQGTFAPVAKINTVRVLLSITANLDWSLQQLDVKNAFLNGDLEEEVYMEMPPGFEDKGDQVCKLKKSLYGLKQSPRAWFDQFTKGYKQAGGDHTLFYQHKNDKTAILIVYVDDIILTGDDLEEWERLKRKLAKEFEIKDLGSLRYFLGMEIARNKCGISVSQRKYVLDLLKETGMMGCKLAKTPVEPSCKKGMRDSDPVDKGAVDDRRSTSGYCTLVWGNLVMWRSKKQSVVARSNAEAELRSVAHGICEVLWLRMLLDELKVLQISDILEYSGACNDRSVVILLVFLASKLIVKKNLDQLNFHKLLGCNCQSPVRKYSSAEPCFSSPDLVRTKDKTYGYSTEDAARKFKAIQAWWRAMTERSYQRIAKPEASPILYHLTTTKNNIKNQRENAAKVIQSHFKRALKRRDYLKMLHAASLLQTVFRAWLTVKKKPSCINFTAMQDQKSSFERWKQSETWRRYVMFIIERHCFVKLKKSVLLIQRAARNWITRRRLDDRSIETSEISAPDLVNASIVIQKYLRGWLARSGYICEVAQVQKVFVLQPKEDLDDLINASIVIQKYLRRWLTRSRFLCEVAQKERTFNLQPKKSVDDLISASIIIQKYLRGWFVRCRHIREVAQIEKAFHLSLEKGVDDLQTIEEVEVQLTAKCSVICNSIKNQHFAATKIQSHFRCLILRRGFQSQKHATLKIQSYFRMSRCLKTYQHHKALTKSATIIQSFVRQWICHREACRRRDLIDAIQRHCRGWLVRREFLSQREAVIKIQSAVRGLKCRMGLHRQTLAALEIQRFVRGQLTRKKLLGTSSQRTLAPNGHISRSSRGCNRSSELTLVLYSVGKLQRWWRGVLSLKLKMRCALIIQSRFRGWIAIRKTTRERHHIVVIQSHWKGYLARKESRGHLLDLRLRMQQSAANVDDGMRIINRLIAALSELLSKKSISGILHTCATLDMATRYSKKCCEKLVDAGAISTLLKLIRSVSRSIPDQEVVKHSLSTLRNLARYPHLVEVLIDCHGSIEIILWELLRNKEEIYFIASEVLKKICSSRKGIEAVRKSPAVLRRLHNLVEELSRKAHNEKRGVRGQMARENTDRRLREAVSLLKMVTEG